MNNLSLGSDIWSFVATKRLSFDTYCTLCARRGQSGIDLCDACHAQFKSRLLTNAAGVCSMLCTGCGVECSLLATGDADFCQDCSLRAGKFLRRIVAPYRYAFPVNRLIKRLKYGSDRQLARVLGTLLANAVKTQCEGILPEVLVPMPLHASRLNERGFNQAQDIARWCAHYLGIEVSASLASRPVDTGSLAGLSRAERQHRILGAFRASDTLLDKHVAIVDDVLTTGASGNELAREIYDSGAASVELWVLARTSSLRLGVS